MTQTCCEGGSVAHCSLHSVTQGSIFAHIVSQRCLRRFVGMLHLVHQATTVITCS